MKQSYFSAAPARETHLRCDKQSQVSLSDLRKKKDLFVQVEYADDCK